jgi:Rad3-related DNA helicase
MRRLREGLAIDWKMILECVFTGTVWEGVDFIFVDEDRVL